MNVRPGAALLGAVLLLGAFTQPGFSAGERRSPARLLVTADEFTLRLSRPVIASGPAIVQLLNRGEDDHDLRLRRISRSRARPTAKWSVVRPGALTALSLRLRRGRYRLWCSLPGHRELGMRATLRVTRGH